MGKERMEHFARVIRQLFAECYTGSQSLGNIAKPDIHSIAEWRIFKDKHRTTRLLELANGDMGKCERFLRVPAYEFHKLMSYYVEQNKKANDKNKNNRQGPGRKANAEWQTNEQDG